MAPAEDLIDHGISGLSLLQVHEDLFWGALLHVVEVQLGKVLGAQPQEDGPVWCCCCC